MNFDDVAVAPLTLDRDVRARLAADDATLAVDRDDGFSAPPRMSHLQGEPRRLLQLESKPRAIFVGEPRRLRELEPLCFPVEARGHEQVHEQGLLVVEVDGVAVLRMVLDAGARTTPKRIERRAVELHVPGARRLE